MSGVRERISRRDHAKRARERPRHLSRVQQQEIGATDHEFHRTDDQKKLIRIGDRPIRIRRRGIVAVLALATILISFFFTLHESGHAQDPTADISTGKAIYEQHCVKSHGQTGRGNGPQAQEQMVRPANFHAQASRSKSDERLLFFIKWPELQSHARMERSAVAGRATGCVGLYPRVLGTGSIAWLSAPPPKRVQWDIVWGVPHESVGKYET